MKLKPAAQAFKIEKYKKPSEALKKALQILRRPGRWIIGNLAITYDEGDTENIGHSCDTKAEKKTAMAFCALGAVQFVNGPAQKSAEGFLREAGKTISNPDGFGMPTDDDIFRTNDHMGFEKTIEMFKLAIKNARKAGK